MTGIVDGVIVSALVCLLQSRVSRFALQKSASRLNDQSLPKEKECSRVYLEPVIWSAALQFNSTFVLDIVLQRLVYNTPEKRNLKSCFFIVQSKYNNNPFKLFSCLLGVKTF